ncbi:MAG: DUF2330 domain-containing protein [bacterium]|nr:DUF2330 domain-containing protein [bacterium]
MFRPRSPTSTTALVLAFLALAAADRARADGAVLAPWGYELYETDQLAIIGHDAAAARETLHVLPGFRGDADDFAWIVPVPSLPEVAASDLDLFEEAMLLTAPVWRSRDGAWGCTQEDVMYAGDGDGNDVDIIEDRIVGIYRTLVLGSTDATALADSLAAWGFLHEGNDESTLAALASYVERSWYFVAMKIDPEAFDDWQMNDGYWYGRLAPVRLTFAADEPVYPLEISSLSAAQSTEVILYTVADARLTFPGATTLYANRVTDGELQEIRSTYPAFGALVHAGDFVTKLRRTYAPDEMTEDLVLAPDDDGGEFHQVFYSGIPLTAVLLLGAGAWLRLRPRRA